MIEEIRQRHADFEARYSPGPDWEPFNQTHRDRGWLLECVAELRLELEDHVDCEGVLIRTRLLAADTAARLKQDIDEAHAAIRWLMARFHPYVNVPIEHAPAIRRASNE